jgi:hypothetical protein
MTGLPRGSGWSTHGRHSKLAVSGFLEKDLPVNTEHSSRLLNSQCSDSGGQRELEVKTKVGVTRDLPLIDVGPGTVTQLL